MAIFSHFFSSRYVYAYRLYTVVALSSRLSFSFHLVLSLQKIPLPMSWNVEQCGRKAAFKLIISNILFRNLFRSLFISNCLHCTWVAVILRVRCFCIYLSHYVVAFCINKLVKWWALDGAQPSMFNARDNNKYKICSRHNDITFFFIESWKWFISLQRPEEKCLFTLLHSFATWIHSPGSGW